MRLLELYIKNFRCFSEQNIQFETVTAFVGTNSAGKSTILQAVTHLLKPDEKFDKRDFHMERADEIRVQATFELSEHERERVLEMFGYPLEKLVVTKSQRVDEKKVYTIQVPRYENRLLDLSYPSGKTKKEYEEAAKKGELPNRFVGLRTINEIREAIREELREGTHRITGWVEQKVKDREIGELLPVPVYIPAFENIDKQTEYKKNNYLGRMLQIIFEEIQQDNEFKRWQRQYENMTNRLFGEGSRRAQPIIEFEEELTGYINEVLDARVKLNFSVPPAEDFILQAFSVHLDDGVTTPVASKGHGAQRAIIWALLRYYLKRNHDENKAFFLVEEPELYLHPQAQRVLLNTLDELSRRGQVAYTTHSPIFVNLERPESIRVVRKEKAGTSISMLPSPSDQERQQIRYLKWMGDAQNEIFFARSVVLYEGATEKLILTHMNRTPTTKVGDVSIERKIRHPLSFDELGCQLVATGGKFSMPFFTKLLTSAGIPYFVIYDRDSTQDFHEDVNRHIENNIRSARQARINSGSHVHHPYLEIEWGIHTRGPRKEHENKPDEVYKILREDDGDWDDRFRDKYTQLKETLYRFAWSCYLGTGFR